MQLNKILWLDTETLSLDPTIASIREISYVAEIDGNQIGDIQVDKIQPIIHREDKLYGHIEINEFVKNYNKKFHPQDPDRLVVFGFHKPLFIYSKAALTFNIQPPRILDPADWLIGKDLISAMQGLMNLIAYVDEHNSKAAGRWVLAGHNIKYDYNVLTYWTKRLLGEEAKVLLEKLNRFVFLDTLELARWMQYSRKLTVEKANLGAIAHELGMDTSQVHTASFDVFACKEIAKILLGLKSQ